MKTKSKVGLSASTKLAIIGVIIGTPVLVFLFSVLQTRLLAVSPIAFLALIVIVSAVFNTRTCKLLYTFYELETPVIAYLPCIGETALIDQSLKRASIALYAVVLFTLGISFLPFKVFGWMGISKSTTLKIVLMWVAIVLLIIIQILKGIGIRGTMKDVSNAWIEARGTTSGIISKFSIFGFVPILRVLCFYGLSKPLSTMVEFDGVTVSDLEGDDEALYVEDE